MVAVALLSEGGTCQLHSLDVKAWPSHMQYRHDLGRTQNQMWKVMRQVCLFVVKLQIFGYVLVGMV